MLWLRYSKKARSIMLPAQLPITNRKLLEVECDPAAHRARRLHQVDGASIAAHDWHISLRQKITQIHQHFHMSGEEAGRNRLTQEDVQIGVGLPRRRVEQIHRCQSRTAGPAVGGR